MCVFFSCSRCNLILCYRFPCFGKYKYGKNACHMWNFKKKFRIFVLCAEKIFSLLEFELLYGIWTVLLQCKFTYASNMHYFMTKSNNNSKNVNNCLLFFPVSNIEAGDHPYQRLHIQLHWAAFPLSSFRNAWNATSFSNDRLRFASAECWLLADCLHTS